MDTTTAPTTAPIETVTPIKPSEAIRLGCLTTRPAKGTWFRDGAACALGAMQVGFGGDPGCGGLWPDGYSAFRDLVLPYPDGSGQGASGAIVMYLNDGADWSREQIADWLEGLGL